MQKAAFFLQIIVSDSVSDHVSDYVSDEKVNAFVRVATNQICCHKNYHSIKSQLQGFI